MRPVLVALLAAPSPSIEHSPNCCTPTGAPPLRLLGKTSALLVVLLAAGSQVVQALQQTTGGDVGVGEGQDASRRPPPC